MNKVPPHRLLMLITDPPYAHKVTEMFLKEGHSLIYRMRALGTASSEIQDLLGLGGIGKTLLVFFLPKSAADTMIARVRDTLDLGRPGTGIAFTVTVQSASRVLLDLSAVENKNPQGEEENRMSENSQYALICALVNAGYSDEVVKAARNAGARGSTILRGHSMTEEETLNSLGMTAQSEKETVLILTTQSAKKELMQAITGQFGASSEASGVVLSVPLDSVIGFKSGREEKE